MKKICFFLIMYFIFIFYSCGKKGEIVVRTQVSGPWNTNSYLIYDSFNKEAAFIDPGVLIDSLIMVIEKKDLDIKYILLTHCHQDHVSGVPLLKKRFPNIKLCFSKTEYNDMKFYKDWRNIYSPELVRSWDRDSSIVNLMKFDYTMIGEPDIYAEDNAIINLGNFIIKTMSIPGHSRGSVCFYTQQKLFTGDIIMYSSVGYIGYKFGSKTDLVNSVRKIYSTFSDNTEIYPGHGNMTLVGYEKENNNAITIKNIFF